MTALHPADPPDTSPAGPGRNPWAALAVLCLGLFMILLDGTIVNIAIPHIREYYDTAFSNIQWVMNAYILGFAVLLVTFGRFGDLWGRRRLFVSGMLLFTLGSAACALAPGIYPLIAFRALLKDDRLIVVDFFLADADHALKLGVGQPIENAGCAKKLKE